MTNINLPYVQTFKDRHGKSRHYFRRNGVRFGVLRGAAGSAEFLTAYQDALRKSSLPKEAGKKAIIAGSFQHLVGEYFKSTEFQGLKDSTKRAYRNSISRLTVKYGALPVKTVQSSHLRKILDSYADRPGAAYDARRVIMILMRFAQERGWRNDNPSQGIKAPRQRNQRHETWSEDDINLFLSHWPIGSRQHLALHLLLYTGQRRSDVVTMGRQFVSEGRIAVKQLKTQARLQIPIHPDLKNVLSILPKTQMTFLLTAFGKPFSAAGFTNWFVKSAKEAGLAKGLTPHGLRYATARKLAEAGCSPHEIAAITGHKTLSEIVRYTSAVNQVHLATKAMATIARTKTVKPVC